MSPLPPIPRRKPLPEAISVTKAAEIIGVSHNTIRRWIRRGYMRAYRAGPVLIRIPRSEVARIRTRRIEAIVLGETLHLTPI